MDALVLSMFSADVGERSIPIPPLMVQVPLVAASKTAVPVHPVVQSAFNPGSAQSYAQPLSCTAESTSSSARPTTWQGPRVVEISLPI